MSVVWARVRDLSTRHHYDVPLSKLERLVARGAVEEIPGRRHRGQQSRRPKHFVRLGSRLTPKE